MAFLCATRLAFGADTGSPPQLTQVSPVSGTVGQNVVISGENLATTANVEFNGVSAQFSLGGLDPEQSMITAIVPVGATTGPIQVTTSYGTATSSNAFTVLPGGTSNPPQLSQIQPMSGVVGERVMIRGGDLATTMNVEFNGVSAQFRLEADIAPGQWVINAYVPAGATSGPIKVTTHYGTATTTDSFIVLPDEPPTIDSFSPASGPPGTWIAINGQNLKYTTNVLLNGVAMFWTTGIDPVNVQLLATVPGNGTTGPITVNSRFGSITSTTNFTVTPAPPLTVDYWPNFLEAGWKEAVVVSDSSVVTDVQQNGLHVPFTVNGPMRVDLDIPLKAQSGFMTFFTAAGTVTSPDPIPVYPLPVISSLEPDHGPVGTPVTVLGQDLDIVGWVQVVPDGSEIYVNHIDSGTISFTVRDAAVGELVAITLKENRIHTGLHFGAPTGVITNRAGTIDGHTPSSDPTPIPPITNAPPRQASVVASRHAGSTELPLLNGSAPVQSPILSIASVGSNALKLSWSRTGPPCVLESADGFPGNSWMPMLAIPNENELVVPQAGKQRFFRLRVASESKSSAKISMDSEGQLP